MKYSLIASSLVLAGLLTGCSVLNLTPANQVYPLAFSEDSPNPDLSFVYQTPANNPDSKVLLESYDLERIAKPGKNEFEKTLHLLNWTNSRWEHSGSNKPSDFSTITILKEAEDGNKFRCVEYGIVLRSVLSSMEIPARTLGLKSKDVEVIRLGAGHVATEAWSAEHQKWFFLDAQFNVVPVLDEVPLNAVEFQDAIVSSKDFDLIDVNGKVDDKRRTKYLSFISKYLYFLDFRFDQREIPYEQLTTVNDKTALMLVPVGTENPKVFQRKIDMGHLVYTTNLNDFYRKPN